MSQVNLEQISAKLESENSADRMLALASLRHVAAQDAVPLLKKVVEDQS